LIALSVAIVLAVELPLVLVGRNGLPPSNLKELISCMSTSCCTASGTRNLKQPSETGHKI
jgi:hypothetical protein